MMIILLFMAIQQQEMQISKGIKFCSSKPFTWNIRNAIHYGAFLTCLLIPKVHMTFSNKVCVIYYIYHGSLP
jgi:hypothetical protein